MAGLSNYLIYYANKTPAFENCPKNTFPSDCPTHYVFCISTHDGAAFPQYSGEQGRTNLCVLHLYALLAFFSNALCIFGLKPTSKL